MILSGNLYNFQILFWNNLVTLSIKTLDLIVEYVFQPKAYVKYWTSLCLLKGLIKVFSKVILEEKH